MEHPGFFERAAPVRLEALAQKVGAQLGPGANPDILIHDVKSLADAGAGDVTFLDNRKYLSQLGAPPSPIASTTPLRSSCSSRSMSGLVPTLGRCCECCGLRGLLPLLPTDRHPTGPMRFGIVPFG